MFKYTRTDTIIDHDVAGDRYISQLLSSKYKLILIFVKYEEIIRRKISDLNDKLSTTHPLVEGLEKLPDEDIKHVYENVKNMYNNMLTNQRERLGDLDEPSFLSFLSSLTSGWVSNVFNKIGTSIK